MENLELIARVNRTEEQWAILSPTTKEAYDILLTEVDEFWDPFLNPGYSRPVFWLALGHA